MTRNLTFKQRFIAIFITVLFVGFAGSNLFFIHTHYIGDVKVTHSHPFDNPNHTHSKTELLTLFSYNHTCALDEVDYTELADYEILERIVSESPQPIYHDCTRSILSLRAPPYFF